MVLGLIGSLRGPNEVLRASPGRELRGKAAGGGGGATGGPRYMKIRGGPERAGPDFSDFFRNGPPGPWDDYLGPWGALGPLFGGAWALYMGVGPCKLISVACTGKCFSYVVALSHLFPFAARQVARSA